MLAKMRSRIGAFVLACARILTESWRRSHAIAQSWTLGRMAPNLPQRFQRGISVIDMVVAMLVIIAVLPTVITDWFNVQTTNWGAAGTIWDLAPLLAIVGLLIWFRQRKGGVSGGI